MGREIETGAGQRGGSSDVLQRKMTGRMLSRLHLPLFCVRVCVHADTRATGACAASACVRVRMCPTERVWHEENILAVCSESALDCESEVGEEGEGERRGGKEGARAQHMQRERAGGGASERASERERERKKERERPFSWLSVMYTSV